MNNEKKKAKLISEKRIEELAQRPWGKMFPEKIELLKQGLCTTCGKLVQDFRDLVSHKEYQISGMCQECQDSVFGKASDNIVPSHSGIPTDDEREAIERKYPFKYGDD